MRKVLLGSGLLAACVAGSASATFIGFGSQSYTALAGAYDVLDVYAMYSSTTDKFLNVFNSDIDLIGATNFYQANGTWANTNSGSNAADSRVAAGASSGNTSPDGSFANWEDGEGQDSTLPPSPGAGWFAANPNPAGNTNGAKVLVLVPGIWQGANGPFGVWIGRFSVLAGPDSIRFMQFGGQIGTGVVGGSGTFFGQDSKLFKFNIPAPGAMALLGLAGLVGRRRRA